MDGLIASTICLEAINVISEAVRLSEIGTRNPAPFLSNLAYALQTRYELEKSPSDLDRAIDVAKDAASRVPKSHPSRATYFYNLGEAFRCRADSISSQDDITDSVNAYLESFESRLAPPSLRVTAARCAATELISRNTVKASELLAEAVALLPTTSPRTLRRSDQQHLISKFERLASDAAALAIRNGKDAYQALQMLELGRGVMASALLETRSDITELMDAYPDTARRFMRLRDELDRACDRLLSDSFEDESLVARRYAAEKKFKEIVDDIRKLDGFESFLQGPQQIQLRLLASKGSIAVLNVSDYGSDAFLVTQDVVKHLPLPQLNYAELEMNSSIFLSAIQEISTKNYSNANRQVAEVMEWLWDVAVGPVLDELGFTQSLPAEKYARQEFGG